MKSFFTTVLLLFTAVIHTQAQLAGTPDKSFGEGGKVLDTSIWATCDAMALQPDGKILTGGYTSPYLIGGKGGFYVARYNQEGSIDESFGEEGKFIIRAIEGANPLSTQAIAVQPDGKIVACGRFITRSPFGNVGIVRLYPDGTIDSSFGMNGFVVTKLSEWNDVIGGMLLQPDGKIVVAGNSESDFSQPGPDFVLRYLPDGTPDESFGEHGVVLTEYTTNVSLGAVTVQEDGKILTGGIYGVFTKQFQVVRYNVDGSLDRAFGEEGFARLAARSGNFSELNDLAIQEDGKIVAAGRYGSVSMALARFESSGKVDVSFGDLQGYTYFYRPSVNALAKNVFITKDNKIMLTGNYFYNPAQQVAAVRYNYNGIIDSSFGENGVAAGGFGESKHGADVSSGVGVLQPDGKVIVSGSFEQNDNITYNVALFRFNGESSNQQPLIVRIKRWLQHRGISWQGVQGGNNIQYYAVQRSLDGITYKEIGRAGKKAGINNYEDDASSAGNSYYRIAAVSGDGSRTYSNTVLISDLQGAKIFPNPVRDNLQLQGLPQTGKTNVSIVDWNGNVRSTATATGTNYSVNTTNLSAGAYLLKIQNNGTTATQPFVKE